ncbi:MAG TPA: MlaD family protein [Solirubrobacteraceae bacterium]|nr:MlaD family protein [Solirubrobacteraceae bacterium]
MRRHRPRVSRFRAGVLGILVIFVVCYLVFGGSLPFGSSPFVLKAVFTSNTELHIPSPVRIAGVEVGQVTGVKYIPHSRDAAVITMDINSNGLPIHANATAAIRSRIFLEGNFYVDLSPGSPNAAVLGSGTTLSAPSTSGPVQLDRVLSALNSDARANLQTLLQGIGGALNAVPSVSADATQDASVRGLTGGQALNQSLRYSVGAFRASAIVNQALLGVQPHDLSNAVAGNEQVFKALAASGPQLGSFVHTFNSTLAALAARQSALSRTIAVLPALLRSTDAADTQLDRSFPPTREFAKAILPGVEQTDATVGAALPWLAQATALASPAELGGLLKDLTPAVQKTAETIGATKNLVHGLDLLARCFEHNVNAAGYETISDPPVGTGLQVYQELFQSAVGIAGASGNFDGNGRYVRSSAGGGKIRAQTPKVGSAGPFYGNFVLQPLGTRPAFAGHPPPLNRSVACYRNPLPSLNAVATGAAP